MAEKDTTLSGGTILDSGVAKYKIVKVLGQGGFGITYLVTGEMKIGNVTTEAKFAIKEHFPEMFATRQGDTITANNDKQDEYASSLADFKAEAKKLQKMGDSNDNIVKVNEIFEANGTAYYVMQYINGKSLTRHVEGSKGGKLTYEEAIDLLAPIFDAVDFLHKSKINHLDIKPDNIMLHEGLNGIVPVLIDFGLSMHFKKNGDKTSPKGVQGISEGYSPLEQYVGIQEFRPETDIYALAATLLYALTGATPKSAAELRIADLRPALLKVMPESAVDGLCKALAKSSDDRTSSVSVLKSDLGVVSGSDDNRTRAIVTDYNKKKTSKNNLPLWILCGIGAAAVIVGCIFLFKPSGKSVEPTQETSLDSLPPQEEVEVVEVVEEPQKPETQHTEDAPQPAYKTPEHSTQKNTQGAASQPSTPQVTSGTLSLPYGTWTGGIRNGQPDGQGRVVFSRNYRYPGTMDEILAGYSLEGTYSNGQLVIGRLFDSAGTFIGSVMP